MNELAQTAFSDPGPSWRAGACASGLVTRVDGLHGPTASIATTMGQLVPFAASVGSPADADVLDICIDVTNLAASAAAMSVDKWGVRATARYATELSLREVCAFYQEQFAESGARPSPPLHLAGERRALIFARFDEQGVDTNYRVTIDDCGSFRSVKAVVTYRCVDAPAFFDELANWHADLAPIDAAMPTGFELATFAGGAESNCVALFTTRYVRPGVPCPQLRAEVDCRLAMAGFGYRELIEGILFIDGAPFSAEAHVFEEHGDSSLHFVGAFDLPR